MGESGSQVEMQECGGCVYRSQKGCQHWNLVGDGEVDGKWPLDFILNENGYQWGVLRSADGLCLTY